MFIFVKSIDSLDVFPENEANNFKVRIPERLNYLLYKKCSLFGLVMPFFRETNIEEIYVVTNFVCESIVGGGKLPVLYRYIHSARLNNVSLGFGMNYMQVKNIDTDVLEIKIINGKNMNLVNFKPGVVYCTFHFVDV